jgi:tripartite-type tricarboxylate transporter receptor subunit TctC
LTTHALIGGLYTLPFDLLMDFEPITQLANEPLLIVGKKSLPANSLKELIAYLRAHPDTGMGPRGSPLLGVHAAIVVAAAKASDRQSLEMGRRDRSV